MEKIKKFIKDDGIYFISFLVLLIITLILVVIVPCATSNTENNYINLITNSYGRVAFICITLFSIFYFFILKNIDKKEMKFEKIFLMMSIPIGLLYLITLPIGKVPDEMSHLYRSYEVSLGGFVSDINEDGIGGRVLPSELTKLNYRDGEDSLETWFQRASNLKITDDKIFMCFGNTALYAFICYLPQALGMFIARIFTNNLFAIVYTAKIFNLAFFIAIMYYAIKLIPFKKLALILIAFLPIVLQEAVSLSSDSFTTAIAVLLVSYVLNLRYLSKEKFGKKDFIVLLLSSIILALCKIVYVPICLIMYIIPNDKFDSKKQKYITITSLILIAFIINLSWLAFASRYLMEFMPNVSSKEQAIYVLTHPFHYIFVVIRTTNFWLEQFIGNIIGNALSVFNISISNIYKYLLLFLLLFSFFGDNNEKNKVDNFTKIIITVSIILVIALLYTSLYVQWTPLEKDMVDGLQGRYFIPILLLIPFLFNNNYIILNKKISFRYILLFIVFLNLHALSYILYSVL